MYQEKPGALSPRGNRLGKTQAWKSSSCSKKKKQIDQIFWSIVCVKEIVRDKARKVDWGQIMEGFEYQTDESELCSVGNGDPLKTLEPQNDAIKGVLEED